MRKRKFKQKLFIGVCGLSAVITASLLIFILGFIFMRAIPSLSWDYILTAEVDAGGFNEGIANAIVGTIILATTSVVVATPLALAVAVYMTEYSKENWFTKTLRFMIDLLAGMPSIVLGVIGFVLLVISLKYITGGFSLIAGAIALAILVLPTIERAAEESLKTVPRELKEGSMALGSTKWQCIQKIVVPYSLSGIITGVVLGIGRAAEESAVVVLTAGYTQFMPRLGLFPKEGVFMNTKLAPLQEGIASLPIAVYHSFEFSHMVPIENGFATATVLIAVVMMINLTAKTIAWKYRIG
ncbi:MAG TPA: phosphate ABC transporter permease PstA [Candidatus Altiarchaeales archaeon]|nr:phosphate ABC transporter permease PstA [Candidatus Altiarchaeales archaeon]